MTADLLAGALHNLADGLAVIDAAGQLAYWNARAEEFFGLPAGEWLHVSAPELYRALAARTRRAEQLYADLISAAAHAEQLPRVEFFVITPRERAIEAQWFAWQGQKSLPGYGVVWRDVTREKELDQMKNQLLSIVSHELRTPLSAIKGFTTTLLREDVQWDEATQRDFLKIIEEETDRLGELIDNLLDMSQVEAGVLRIAKESVSLRNLVREAISRAQRRSAVHWFVMDLPAELVQVWADPRRIRQVLNNLLENAIKYSPAGGQITITCEVEGEGVLVSVADQGKGILPEHLDKIFERFFQVEAAHTRQTGGSGLGLSIVKGIIEAHGGRIWAESTPGQGSVFRFTLPSANETGADEK